MIKYQKGFKYQLFENFQIQTDILGFDIETHFITLDRFGCLFIRKGYAWDGASGPTFDTDSSMEASLVHDALYQLMRLGLLPAYQRNYCDNLFESICIDKKMWKIRAKSWCSMVKRFAKKAADAKSRKKVYVIP
jgi:hypothetical protein